MNQTHTKFKAFVASGTDVIQRAEAVMNSYGISPKSLGVEFLESSGLLVLTVGYRDDEPSFPFKITQVNLGKLELVDKVIASALEAAATKIDSIICHEFYVDASGEFFAVFMAKA
jgi:hypothetical protein